MYLNRGTYIGDAAEVLIVKQKTKGSKQQKRSLEEDDIKIGPTIQRCCGNCGKTGHNVRTC